MNEIIAAIPLGLAAGATHVFAGPDHLAAIAPLALDARRRMWLTGLAWGIGHSVGVWGLAVAAWLLRESLPLDALGPMSERLVGLLLILLGLWGWRRLLATRIHIHVHEHDGVEHAHFHMHEGDTAGDHHDAEHEAHTHSAIGIGTLHGLAGAAHLIAVLPAVGLTADAAAASYLIAFCISSIVAMSAFSWSMGAVAGHLQDKGVRGDRWLAGCSCTAAIGVGIWWLIANA